MKNITKKLNMLAAMVAVAACGVVGVQANSYDDFDVLNWNLNSGDSETGNFNIATGDGDAGDNFGYDPATEVLVSALAYFSIANNGQELKLKITLGSEVFSQNTPALITFFDATLQASGFIQLNNNGEVDYTIENTGGAAFTVNNAYLEVVSADKLIGVPDGGATLGLLGLALLGVGAFRKRILS